jgi:hypothetical protein
MKRTVIFLLLICASLSAHADDGSDRRLGIGYYLFSGYNFRSISYTDASTPTATVDASGFSVECGLSFRYMFATFISADVSFGATNYASAKSALSSKGSYYSDFLFVDFDDSAYYLAADVFINIPVIPVNLFAGYKYNFFQNALVGYIEGVQLARFGIELVVTRIWYPRLTVEIPVAAPQEFATSYNSGVVKNQGGFSIQAAIEIALN